MIYTVGYQRLPLARLQDILHQLDATLVDVRSRWISRKTGYSGKALAAALGSRYRWQGAVLGGLAPGVLPEGIAWLERAGAEGNVVLLCMEEAPGDCHRHRTIAAPHPGLGVLHIFREELIPADSLQAAIEGGEEAEYDYIDLDEHLAEIRGG